MMPSGASTPSLENDDLLDFVVEIVRRIDGEPGFKVLPRRWVVERTFSWLIRWRRLLRDFEQRLDVSEAMIHIAMGSSSCASAFPRTKFPRCR